MKKLLSVLMVLVLGIGIFAFAACGEPEKNTGDNAENGAAQIAEPLYLEELDDSGEIVTDDDIASIEDTTSEVDLLPATDTKFLSFKIYGTEKWAAYVLSGWSSETEGRPTDIVVPATYKNLPVIGISQGAFRDDTKVTSLKTGSKMLFIGKRSFTGCTALTSVVLGPNVYKLAASAFRDCTSLTDITLPSKVTNLYGSTFRNCTSLTKATITGAITNIGAEIFSGCSSLTELSFADFSALTKIGSFAFYGCEKLSTVTADAFKNVATIGTFAFYNCTKFSYNDFDALFNIGDYAFGNCTSLKEFTLLADTSKNKLKLGFKAFIGCTGLTSVYIANSDVAAALSTADAAGCIIQNATTVYLKRGVNPTEFISNNYTEGSTSSGYTKFAKK